MHGANAHMNPITKHNIAVKILWEGNKYFYSNHLDSYVDRGSQHVLLDDRGGFIVLVFTLDRKIKTTDGCEDVFNNVYTPILITTLTTMLLCGMSPKDEQFCTRLNEIIKIGVLHLPHDKIIQFSNLMWELSTYDNLSPRKIVDHD